jgi:hypothetical protein
MIRVEASWEDQRGQPRAVPAWLENRSAGGACIRLKTQIDVGSKLRIQGRWEQISGIAKYCRSVGDAYLVGIQRDTPETPSFDRLIPASVPIQERHARAEESVHERKPMQRKWSELMHRHGKQDEVDDRTNGDAKLPNSAPQMALATDETSADLGRGKLASFHIEVFSAEDIYRTAGIMNLRRGSSISKVAGILHSDHARGLPKEARQAAVLMALDAAGIAVDEVLQDAKTRQDALNSYEAELRKEVEAEWACKADENVQIQAELERVKARYMARISRNLEGVAREKVVFNDWLTMKQQESQSIAEAVQLCLKSTASETAGSSLPSASMAVGKPM